MKQKQTKHVDIDNARVEEQRAEMERIIAADHCPFCPENLELYHKTENIRKTDYWLLTTNSWPYANTKFHFLFILNRHAEELFELTPAEGADLIELLGWVQKKYHIPGGGFAMRFGETAYSAATVKHLHAHFLVPEIEAKDYKPLRFKVGKNREDL